MNIYENIKQLLDIVKKGDMNQFTSLFKNNFVDFDSPLFGRVCNNVVAESIMEKSTHWINTKAQKYECFNQIITSKRVYTEFNIYRKFHGRDVDIPIAVFCEMENKRVIAMRIYHACEYIKGHKIYRAAISNPIIKNPSEPNEAISEIHRRYFKALREKDVDTLKTITSQYGSIRGSAKCDFYFEAENMLEGFKNFFNNGALPLQLASITTEGREMFIEFILEGWGDKYFGPQCGSAAYTHDKDGRISSIRIYDDMVF